MNYRRSLLLAEETITGSGTKTIDIDVTEPISRIEIKLEVTKVHNHMDAPGCADITKIELVDGSDILFSMNGYGAMALNLYDRRVPTRLLGEHIANMPEQTFYGIDFGRHLWDGELAFDPKKFINPQLKISYNVALSDTAATTGSLEVWAEMFDEKVIAPVGFLMSKEHYSYTIGTSGSYEHVDLPRDYPIRKMLLRAYLDDSAPFNAISEARLDEDNLKRIPFDEILEDYFIMMKGIWLPIHEQIECYTSSDGTFIMYVTPTDYYVAPLGMGQSAGVEPYHGAGQSGGKLDVRAASSSYWEGVAYGYLPNHCFEFPFGKQDDLDDWYDVTRIGKLRLRLKSAGGTTGEVLLQQLRRY